MDPDAGPEAGVFFDRPDENLISELSRYLIDAEAA
jgi:hypothetical protein